MYCPILAGGLAGPVAVGAWVAVDGTDFFFLLDCSSARPITACENFRLAELTEVKFPMVNNVIP
jgi:hypothetical protein